MRRAKVSKFAEFLGCQRLTKSHKTERGLRSNLFFIDSFLPRYTRQMCLNNRRISSTNQQLDNWNLQLFCGLRGEWEKSTEKYTTFQYVLTIYDFFSHQKSLRFIFILKKFHSRSLSPSIRHIFMELCCAGVHVKLLWRQENKKILVGTQKNQKNLILFLMIRRHWMTCQCRLSHGGKFLFSSFTYSLTLYMCTQYWTIDDDMTEEVIES